MLPDQVEPTVAVLAGHLWTRTAYWRRLGLREKAFLKVSYLRLVRRMLLRGGPQAEQLLGVIEGLLAMR